MAKTLPISVQVNVFGLLRQLGPEHPGQLADRSHGRHRRTFEFCLSGQRSWAFWNSTHPQHHHLWHRKSYQKKTIYILKHPFALLKRIPTFLLAPTGPLYIGLKSQGDPDDPEALSHDGFVGSPCPVVTVRPQALVGPDPDPDAAACPYRDLALGSPGKISMTFFAMWAAFGGWVLHLAERCIRCYKKLKNNWNLPEASVFSMLKKIFQFFFRNKIEKRTL